MAKEISIRLGYAVGTGEPVDIPLAHTFVTGQTQVSGKTTTLQAIVARSGRRALAFVTKRGESMAGRSIRPYLPQEGKQAVHWRFVETIMASAIGQRALKYERLQIINAARGAMSLDDVRRNITRLLAKAKSGSPAAGIYELLGEYLDLVLPEMRSLNAAHVLDLRPGLNVMDLVSSSPEMQALAIGAAVEHVNEHEKGVLILFPEAWQFAPRDRNTAAKFAIEKTARMGSVLGNFAYSDSQDIVGVSPVLRQQSTVWIVGVQGEANETKRALAVIKSKGIAAPKSSAVATLEVGQFFACFGRQAIKTYVQPAGLSDLDAVRIARGLDSVLAAEREPSMARETSEAAMNEIVGPIPEVVEATTGEDMASEEMKELSAKFDQLIGALGSRSATAAVEPAPAAAMASGNAIDEDAMYLRFKSRLLKEAPSLLKLVVSKPELHVEFEPAVVRLKPAKLDGKIGKLIMTGFFDAPRKTEDLHKELKRIGVSYDNRTFGRSLSDLCTAGALTLETAGYQRNQEVKIVGVEK